MIGLEKNHYGKRLIRFLRLGKRAEFHEVSEWEVDVFLEGGLNGAYLSGDNSSVVPTDTLKNAVLALAYDLENVSRDGFARALAEHFLSHYEHLTACDVEVREKLWTRLAPEGKPHPHSFVREATGTPFSKARNELGKSLQRSAGIRDVVMLKTAESAFAGFRKCEFTTLPEATDRILATSLDAEWEYAGEIDDLDSVVIDLMLDVFAGTHSTSVQRTLFQMGEAALQNFPGLTRIGLSLSNKHYLNIDLSRLGRPAEQKRIFLPTENPYGCIEAVVVRNV